jgi:hypothetical protein
MSQLMLEAVATEGFSCTPQLEDTKLNVVFSGTGDVSAVDLLGGYLKRLHREAQRVGVSEVRCDFRKLSFMNSSCFKAFVVWIDTVKTSDHGYRICFVTEPTMQWQRRSLEALRRLATSVVSIEGG